ncbi:MAG TPA: FKBP-type peptidyl-prolyl cis-trans isomerase [Caulobacter sp.]|nr:FKBP-type peptidyl-prolyl cis-trans isomerase [Caulobacter sp.]
MRLFPLILAAVAALSLAGCSNERLARKNNEEGTEFLKENATKPGVTVLKSGVQYLVMRSGPQSGLKPKKGDEMLVHYEGKLLNGEVFDSSFERGKPTAMQLGGLIPAWLEVLPMMRPGDEWVIYVPPEAGYGKEGGGPIPPNATLIFRIQLIDVLPSGRNIARG